MRKADVLLDAYVQCTLLAPAIGSGSDRAQESGEIAFLRAQQVPVGAGGQPGQHSRRQCHKREADVLQDAHVQRALLAPAVGFGSDRV